MYVCMYIHTCIINSSRVQRRFHAYGDSNFQASCCGQRILYLTLALLKENCLIIKCENSNILMVMNAYSKYSFRVILKSRRGRTLERMCSFIHLSLGTWNKCMRLEKYLSYYSNLVLHLINFNIYLYKVLILMTECGSCLCYWTTLLSIYLFWIPTTFPFFVIAIPIYVNAFNRWITKWVSIN